jgi:hypothetical protein
MTVCNSYTYIFKKLLKRGPFFLWTYFRESILFDLTNGTNTHFRSVKPEKKQLYKPDEYDDGVIYVASFTSVVNNTLNVAKEFLGEKFYMSQFVDLGCGKGKSLLLYALDHKKQQTYPCIGIEYDGTLYSKAMKNLVRLRLYPNTATVICDSATEFQRYISTHWLIVYIYNSFQGDTFRKTLDRLSNYPHLLIYVDPHEKSVLSEYGYDILATHDGKYNADTWLVAANPKISEML